MLQPSSVREFIRALRGIWTEDSFTLKGDFYRFTNYSMKPKPIEPLPEIFQGGSSRAARDMASRVSDWYFTNGNTPEEIREAGRRHPCQGEGQWPQGRDRRQCLRHRSRDRGRGARSARRDHRQGQPRGSPGFCRSGQECRQGLAGRRRRLGEILLRGSGAIQ